MRRELPVADWQDSDKIGTSNKRVSSVAREGIEAEKQFKASFRLALYLAARTTWRLGVDQTMHLLMMIFRWLAGFLSGGLRPARAGSAYLSIRATRGPVRTSFFPSDVSHVGWITVRPVLERMVGLPCWRPVLAGIPRRDGGQRRPCPVRSDRLVRGCDLTPGGCTDPSKPAYPIWG